MKTLGTRVPGRGNSKTMDEDQRIKGSEDGLCG